MADRRLTLIKASHRPGGCDSLRTDALDSFDSLPRRRPAGGGNNSAARAAALYTLTGTAKRSGLDLEAYPRAVLTQGAEHLMNRIGK
ncbi:MAG: hypothetical protein IPK63_01035 [Candidatus Competibacteraceae bacterium]|nr:hypothetical protein [Candidatus Competibacteraceae bacterium]